MVEVIFMLDKTIPLTGEGPAEVPLPYAPLVRVIAQVRFPPILSINTAEKVANFQESLRSDYPHLEKDHIRSIEFGPASEPNISDAIIWRFADRSDSLRWRVSLGLDFVALETSNYDSRTDFHRRFLEVLSDVETCFNPAETQRIGLRYIDRINGNGVSKVSDLIQPGVLGILHPDEGPQDLLRRATVNSMTQAQFEAEEGTIQGRWGKMPANTTFDPDALQPISEASWVLDLDMYSTNSLPFKSKDLVETTMAFSARIYSVFRLMVTDEFIRFYGTRHEHV